MWLFMRLGPFFYNKRKARQDEMFILTFMLYCTSTSCKIQVAKVATKRKKWRLNENFSRQREKASRIGDRIGCNFKPCILSSQFY